MQPFVFIYFTAQQDASRNKFVTESAFNRDCNFFCYFFFSQTSFVSILPISSLVKKRLRLRFCIQKRKVQASLRLPRRTNLRIFSIMSTHVGNSFRFNYCIICFFVQSSHNIYVRLPTLNNFVICPMRMPIAEVAIRKTLTGNIPCRQSTSIPAYSKVPLRCLLYLKIRIVVRCPHNTMDIQFYKSFLSYYVDFGV